ncbi:VWA domain-containing protein [Aeoliella sp. ICT_H6.2]|uniref:VWA domain-containing protein n=1 Tax=Aeoliella straminimaris TaxID=2954799 RepID=A0A9X2FCM9_9BACT|nr:VWA domain-containing protein [Aeoliella straminimaris]MCO6046607.1 VWA domain-containing protein [Aeoliella straminimaris]
MIEQFSNFHFLRPWWLLMLPVAVVVWWFWQRRSDALSGWRSQIDPKLLEALVVGRESHRDWRPWLLLAAWLLVVLAVAGPTWRLEPNPFAADAQPLLILLKADDSMNQTPPEPSRMERAHLKIEDLAELRQGQPLGLIAYAGSAHLVLPPTHDTEVVAKMASQVSPAIMPKPGDRLDLAIEQATKLLAQLQQGGSLLVVADTAEIDTQAVAALSKLEPSFPIQFLSLGGDDSPEGVSIQQAAGKLHAEVQALAVDDQDLTSVISFAERRAFQGLAGESDRWQEAGYWLSPVIALIVALSFRRRRVVTPEGQS